MNSKLKYSTISMMALLALKADAVGLGELVVHSDLGEPLRAEIPLLQSNGEFQSADEMFANIASQEEHTRKGLNGFLARQSIKLKLEETVNDDVVLRLTSKNPINEPFMNFLLELKWQTGRMIKEYTVLLDPPGFSTANTITSIIKPKPAFKPVTTKPSNSAAAPIRYSTLPKTPTEFKDGVYGPVQRGETLSEIAMIVRPAGHNIRLVDMMSAIQRNNPQAFINGQADLLMQDAVLKIPELSEVLAQRNVTNPITNSAPREADASIAALNDTLQSTVEAQTEYSNFIATNRPTLAGLTLSMTLDKSFLLSAKLNQVTESYTEVKDVRGVASETEINPVDDSTVIEDVAQTPVDAPLTEQVVATVADDFDGVVEEPLFDEIAEEPLFDEPELYDEDGSTEIANEDYSTTVTPVDDINSQTTDSSDATQTSSSLFRYLAIAGTAIVAGVIMLWMFIRRRQTVEPVNVQIAQQSIPQAKPQFNIKPEYLAPRKSKSEAEEVVINSINSHSQNNNTDKNYVDTVVMSPEEFKSVGIDINDQSKSTELSDKEIENISSDEDEALIKDYLDTVEIPADSIIAQDVTAEEPSEDKIDYNQEASDQVLDISVPLDHADNEVNEIITDILEGEDFSEQQNSSNTVDEQTEDSFEIEEIIELEPETPESEAEEIEHNIEDLVVNFQNSSPEREFEREVSVFMAYGDYNGAEVLIEDALKTDPHNPIYKLALLSLYKATGKYGAALILSEELSEITKTLSEQDRKKLELLSDDLHDDDNNITIAS